MSEAQNNNAVAETKIMIMDTRRVLMLGCVALFSTFFCVVSLFGLFSADVKFWHVLLYMVISIFFCLMFNTHRQGYIINLEDRTLEFPGGAVESNDISGIFNVTKYFSRKSVYIDGINQISTEWITHAELKRTIFGHMMPIFQELFYPRNHMLVHGAFGTLRFRFFSESKRDMLYATIAQVNEMGTPVVHR